MYVFHYKSFLGEKEKEKEMEMEKEGIGGSSILWHTSKPLKFSRTRCYLPQHKHKEDHFSFFCVLRRSHYFSHGDPKLVIKIQRLHSSSSAPEEQ